MMTSPLKWAGSKRELVPYLDMLYAPHRHRRLVEPFVGSMAVALGLGPERALLGDTNKHLVNFHQHVQRGLVCSIIEMRHDEALYYAHRERFNTLGGVGQESAELFLYLNRSCFNGLCRVNKSGHFNVPFGKHKTVNYQRDLSAYVPLLRGWQIVCADFDDLDLQADDFVYLDPPYDGTFTDYSEGGFSWEDQVRLVKKFSVHPGPVVASNRATARVIELYRDLGYEVKTTEMPRSISSDGDRAPALEMVATKGGNTS